MNVFTASNGITIYVRDGGTVQFQHGTREESCGILQIFPHSEWWQTLREFFQAEADERLGRWRWPENPEYVVYPKEDGLFEVLHEPTGLVLTSTVTGNAPFSDEHAQAARAYLAAHPEPKPWHDAEDGEVWALTGAGGLEQPWRRLSGRWVSFSGEMKYDAVHAIAGRRIWPEVSS